MAGFETSTLDDRHKTLFRLLDRVNHNSASITAADLDPPRAAGWTDEALYFAITVCALFNFYNRWIDATGVHGLSDDAHREGGKRLAQSGYTGLSESVERVSVLKRGARRALVAFMRTFWTPMKDADTSSSKPFPYPSIWP